MDSPGFYYLKNAASYKLERVQILLKANEALLIIIGYKGSFLKGGYYKTLKGAKVAFSRMFSRQIKKKKNLKPVWRGGLFSQLCGQS